ncbi:hypothetical protein BX600DRAFT_317884 [Xylariales sp. PMI_506]|nr:hypothetical protein BX600DRAFT_317884 [Xylariales sp. PMI_506]
MVSIFGLKIGGDKKKKPERGAEKPTILRDRNLNRDIDDGDDFFTTHGGPAASYAASIYSEHRPGSALSNRLSGLFRPKKAFYGAESSNLASSMVNLPKTNLSWESNLPALKPTTSNPNIGMRWNNGSTSSLGQPAAVQRPSTSSGQKPWLAPIETQLGKGISAPSVRSPLSQHHSQSSQSGDPAVVPNAFESHPLPRPLQIRKQTFPPVLPPVLPPRSALRNPPSPPRSVKTSEELDSRPILERPIIPAVVNEVRPSSRGSYRSLRTPTSLKELYDIEDDKNFGPMSLPSPPISLPRVSDETSNRLSMNAWGEPIIQNVRAKRETMTISAARRRSLEMMVDSLGKLASPATQRQPTTFFDDDHDDKESEQDSPSNWENMSHFVDFDGPPNAPFSMNQRPSSGYGDQRPRLARTGVPAAAVGALGRPMRQKPNPAPKAANRPAPLELPQFSTRWSIESSDSDEHSDRPESPESPVIPLTGPLSSPRFPPSKIPPAHEPSAQESPQEQPEHKPPIRKPKEELDTNFRFPDWSALSEDAPTVEERFPDWSALAEDAPPVEHKPAITEAPRSTPMPEFTSWPLSASPSVSSSGSAAVLQPSRTQSPFGVPSFSRPWTSTNARPSTPVKRTEVSVPSGLRGPVMSPRGPPPRITPNYGIKHPANVETSMDTGFI